MGSHWIRVGLKSNSWCPPEERRQKQGDRSDVRMEAEIGITLPQPRSQGKLEEAGESRAFGGSTALLASGFQTSSLQN